jgi:hypothetical protein
MAFTIEVRPVGEMLGHEIWVVGDGGAAPVARTQVGSFSGSPVHGLEDEAFSCVASLWRLGATLWLEVRSTTRGPGSRHDETCERFLGDDVGGRWAPAGEAIPAAAELVCRVERP